MLTEGERMFVANCRPSKSPDEFVEFWAWLYPDRTEPAYTENIGRAKTFEQVQALFSWKFPRFAEFHRDRLQSDYETVMQQWQDGTTPYEFLNGTFKTQGPIWKLFWLHCCCPTQFPIFDQHVHRAMIFIQEGGHPTAIRLDTDPALVFRSYVDRYLPFHATFHAIRNRGPCDREIDRALYMFGQMIGRGRWEFGR